MPSSDHQNSVKSLPKVQDSESLDSKIFRVSSGPNRKLVHIRRSTCAFGTSTRGSSKSLNRGPTDRTSRHCFTSHVVDSLLSIFTVVDSEFKEIQLSLILENNRLPMRLIIYENVSFVLLATRTV
jgi:hypothetical protein